MKKKEICERTGLTQKALRLYEEKGLIAPQRDNAGRNRTREYSGADLRRLQTIAMLRRALFTLAEIKEMLDDPGSIQKIYPRYLEWVRQQKEQLERLYEVSAGIDISTVESADELTEKIKFAAANMPLPVADIHFHFKQLDEMEDERRIPTAEEQLDALLPSKEYRQAYVSISRDKLDDTLVRSDLLNDTRVAFRTEESGPVQNQEYRTGGQRTLRWGLTLGALGTAALFLAALEDFDASAAKRIVCFILFATFAAARIILLALDHRRSQKRWLHEIGWENQKSRRNKKKIVRIVTGGILGLALIAGGFAALTWYLIPTEPAGGPSTEGIDLNAFWDGMELDMFAGLIQNINIAVDISGDDVYRLDDPNAMAVGPDKIYFQWGSSLYSINADYTNLTKIDTVCSRNGAKSVVEKPEEGPCRLIYDQGYIYYITLNAHSYYLVRHKTGTKIKPEKLRKGWCDAIGMSEDGEIICYSYDHGWQEIDRVKVN